MHVLMLLGHVVQPQTCAKRLPSHPFHILRRPAYVRRSTCFREWQFRRRVAPQASAASEAAQEAVTGNCYGCGIKLQTRDPQLAGFVEPQKYATKKKHRQLDQLLCTRCQELSNGAMIPAVEDFAQVLSSSVVQRDTGFEGKRLLTPDQLRQSLTVVRDARALVVLLVDLLDASGSLLGRVRDLVGSNPIVLIGTKADLLPEGTREGEVAEWLQAAVAFKKINAVSVHLVSARTGEGISEAVAAIRRERRGRDVYVIGAANVGKSAFIRALVRDMSTATSRQYDPQAPSRVKYLPVESAMPGTTLQLIPMEVFAAGGVLYDTPGLHLHHRVPHILTPEENKALHPRRRLRPYVAPTLGDLLAGAERPAAGGTGSMAAAAAATALPAAAEVDAGGPSSASAPLASYQWGGLVRIDVVRGPPALQLVFCGPPALRVVVEGPAAAGELAPASAHAAPAAASEGRSEQGEGEAGLFGAESVALRGGMRLAKRVSLVIARNSNELRPVALADVAVSGVPGWVSVQAAGRAGQRIELQVWAPVGVEVFSRPPLPVPLL